MKHAVISRTLGVLALLACAGIHGEDRPRRPALILAEPGAPDAPPAPAAIPVKITVETHAADPAPAAAAPARSLLSQVLDNNVVLTAAISGMLFALKWASDKFKLDAQRWEGVIMHCYNEAENLGVLNKWRGNDKLKHAMQLFDDRFRAIFGADPTAKDREDARLDFARTAFHDAAASKTAA